MLEFSRKSLTEKFNLFFNDSCQKEKDSLSFCLDESGVLLMLKYFLMVFFFNTQTGCLGFFGAKPIERKSTHYKVLDLSKENQKWKKLTKHLWVDASRSGHQNTDHSFQSEETSSIIALNSTYQVGGYRKNLRKLTQTLLSGFTTIEYLEEKELSKMQARQITVRGLWNDRKVFRKVMLKTIVFFRKNCIYIYDMMYIASLDSFSKNEEEKRYFNKFVNSFQFLK